MIQAYKTVIVPVELMDGVRDVYVPLTVELLRRVEETAEKSKGGVWFRFSKRDKSMVDVYREFCEGLLPDDIDVNAVQPTFYGLFFSSVTRALRRSIVELENSMNSTDESEEPTEETKKED